MAKVLYEKRNRIGYITLNRPDALNALDTNMGHKHGKHGVKSLTVTHQVVKVKDLILDQTLDHHE